jgi:hypothetical protein
MVFHRILSNKRLIILCFIINLVYAQLYIPADPFDLLFIEQKIMMGGNDPGSLMIRPIVLSPKETNHNWSFKVRNEFFYNDGGPNLENTSDRWIGNGISLFTSANIAYNNDFIFASIKPYYFRSQNTNRSEPQRILKFSNLNDNVAHTETPYISSGFRETQLYLNFKGIGGGFSNANMWWGPGIHSSLMMTNNTTGFGHLMLGTINEKRINDWGFNGRYIFSKFGEKSESKPFYSGFIFNTTYYSEPIITIGFSRVFLSGGQNTDYDISSFEAALLPFQFVKIEEPENQEYIVNPVDQTYTGYINLRFPRSGLVMFLEYGRNEGPESFNDLILHPDQSRAYIFGVRKYGLFNNINLMFGFEYANLIQTPFWQLRDTRDWNSASQFDFNTYDGRYWAATSGPDSDDFTIYLAYNINNISIIPSINFERHNVSHPNSLVYQYANTLVYDNFYDIYFIEENRTVLYDMSHLAEGKIEFKFDIRYLFKGYRFSFYYEFEKMYNQAFLHSSSRSEVEVKNSNIFWFGVERYFKK